MNVVKMTREEILIAVLNIMHFENKEILDITVDALSKGNSVLVDNISYIGNGRYVDRKLKNRYKYKLIVPIVDRNKNLYSTDSFESQCSSRAVQDVAKYAIYMHTRQLVIGIVNVCPTDYDEGRFDFGYTKEHYGFSKVEVI